jgi:protein-tyrosine phosphatase
VNALTTRPQYFFAGLARRTLDFVDDLRDLRLRPLPSAEAKVPEHRILFLCLGNICRSPLALALFRTKLADAGLLERVAVASAGTAALPGRRAHRSARAVGRRHGLRLGDARARKLTTEDFDRFDRVLAFDRRTEEAALKLGRDDRDRSKVALVADVEIADPLGGGRAAFERAYAEIDNATDRLLADVQAALVDPHR